MLLYENGHLWLTSVQGLYEVKEGFPKGTRGREYESSAFQKTVVVVVIVVVTMTNVSPLRIATKMK